MEELDHADIFVIYLLIKSSLFLYPVQIVVSPGESRGKPNLTTRGSTKRHNSNFNPSFSGFIIESKGPTAIPVACPLAASCVHADNTVADNSVDIVASLVGDEREILNHSENRADTTGRI